MFLAIVVNDFEAILTHFEKKKNLKNFMLKYFFQKIETSNFLKTFTTPRGMNGLDGLRGP